MTFHSFFNIFLNIKRIFAVARNRTHAMAFSWAQITLGTSISGLYQHFSSGTHFPREGPQLSGLNPERLGQKRESYLRAMPSPLIILILFVVTWQGIILLSLIFTTSRFFVQHRYNSRCRYVLGIIKSSITWKRTHNQLGVECRSFVGGSKNSTSLLLIQSSMMNLRLNDDHDAMSDFVHN